MKDFLNYSDIVETIESCKKFLTENPPTEANNLLVDELKNYLIGYGFGSIRIC